MTTDTVGGVWTYCLELVRALAAHNVHVTLATMGRPVSYAQRSEAALLPNLSLHESQYKLEWMEEPWSDVEQAGHWLLELERQCAPDVIHLNGYVHAALPWRRPVLVVGHSCVLSWWQAVKGTAAPDQWRTYRRAVKRGLQAADVVVAPTRAMLLELNRLYGPLKQTSVIYNAREAAMFRPSPKEPFILSAGRLWDEAKNLAALEAIAPHLRWPIFVAGETAASNPAAADSRLVHCLGQLTPQTLAAWFSRASIYALPACCEPFGLSVLEAALSGCALVLGEVPSLREIWADCALYVPPGDESALRAAVQSLIDDAHLRERLSQHAHRRAMCYVPDRMACEYMGLYRQLRVLRRRTAPPQAVLEGSNLSVDSI